MTLRLPKSYSMSLMYRYGASVSVWKISEIEHRGSGYHHYDVHAILQRIEGHGYQFIGSHTRGWGSESNL
jgi:hypothetical protein